MRKERNLHYDVHVVAENKHTVPLFESLDSFWFWIMRSQRSIRRDMAHIGSIHANGNCSLLKDWYRINLDSVCVVKHTHYPSIDASIHRIVHPCRIICGIAASACCGPIESFQAALSTVGCSRSVGSSRECRTQN